MNNIIITKEINNNIYKRIIKEFIEMIGEITCFIGKNETAVLNLKVII